MSPPMFCPFRSQAYLLSAATFTLATTLLTLLGKVNCLCKVIVVSDVATLSPELHIQLAPGMLAVHADTGVRIAEGFPFTVVDASLVNTRLNCPLTHVPSVGADGVCPSSMFAHIIFFV